MLGTQKDMKKGTGNHMRRKVSFFIALSMILLLIPLVAGASATDWFNTLTNGNPVGSATEVSFSTSNELSSGTVVIESFSRQSLDNDYTRFTLTYTAPAGYYSCLFQSAGDLFFYDSYNVTTTQKQTIAFDLQNGILASISSEFTIIFYTSDDDCFVINTEYTPIPTNTILYNITNGNPVGEQEEIEYNIWHDDPNETRGEIHSVASQKLDNGYTRFIIKYTVPEMLSISVFNPPDGEEFKYFNRYLYTSSEKSTLTFDVDNEKLVDITISIGFIDTQNDYYWVLGLNFIPGIVRHGSCGDNLNWVLDDEGTLTISGSGNTIEAGMWKKKDIRRIVIDAGITSIGDESFSGCSNITSFAVPEGVTSIGYAAFADCSSLTSISLPESVTSIGYAAFYNCNSLASISIPEGVTSIEGHTFWQCSNLTSITIPDSVTGIGELAFAACSNLTSITIPEGVTSIEAIAFAGCSSLTSITLPDGLNTIMDHAFYECTNLTSITIPDSMTNIRISAFEGCNALESVDYAGTAEQWSTINIETGNDCLTNAEINYGIDPSSHTHVLTENPQVDATCTTPGTETYWSCDICGKLFSDEEAANEIDEPVVIPALGHSLEWHERIEATEFEDGTDEYWSCFNCGLLFSDEDGMNEIPEPVVLPASGHGEGNMCGESLYWTLDDQGVLTISGSGEMNSHPWTASDIRSVIIDEEVTSIVDEAFSGCGNLTSVSIPGSMYYIGSRAFANCTALTSVGLSDNCDFLGEGAFYLCTSLTSITMPEFMSNIGKEAFYGCSSLNSICIPSGIGCIAESTFQGCSNLTEITIPKNIVRIEANAFAACNSLYYIYYTGTQIQWESIDAISTGNSILSTSVLFAEEDKVLSLDKMWSGDVALEGMGPGSPNTGLVEFLFTPNESGFYRFNSFTSDSYCEVYCSGRDMSSSVWFSGTNYSGDMEYFEDVMQQYGHIPAASYIDCELEKNVTYRFEVNVDSSEYSGIMLNVIIEKKGAANWSVDGDTLRITGNGLINCGFYYESFPKNIKHIIIEEGITGIGSKAFSDCVELESITVPKSVTIIGDYAFYHCHRLASIIIPNNVTCIGKYVFYGCNSLTSITVPDNVTSIGQGAFQDCAGLTSITIPHGLVSIGSTAFSNCTCLTDIMIPNGVISIGYGAFSGCSSLTSVTIPVGVTSIEGSAFTGCSNLTTVTIPDGVTSIGGWAFSGCKKLTGIIIPESVTQIWSNAFSYCSSLTSITLPPNVVSIGDNVFYNCTSLTDILIPETVSSIGYAAFQNCNSLKNITIPDSVTNIGEYAFSGCSELERIIIPEGVKSIGRETFSQCSSLTSIAIPESVVSIGSNAFSYCNNLKCITISDNVINIDYTSFSNWYGVLYTHMNTYTAKFYSKMGGSFRVPGTNYGLRYLFNNETIVGTEICNTDQDLLTIEIPQYVTRIGNEAFINCTALRSIIIPDGITSIGSYAFHGCNNLRSITIPDGVTDIGDSAFAQCSSLTSIIIPNGVTSIENSVFYGCRSLASIVLPKTLTQIGNYAFAYCSNLQYLTIPDGVVSIGDYVFEGSGLMKLEVPESVTTFGNGLGIDDQNLTVYCYSFSDADYWADSLGCNLVYLDTIDISGIREIVHIALANGRFCGAKRPDCGAKTARMRH